MKRKYRKILKSLTPFLDKNNYFGRGGKRISHSYRVKRKFILIAEFKRLRDSKYKLDNVKLFMERHFSFLFNEWLEQNLSASDIQNRSSALRIFANEWLKKPGMIQKTTKYIIENPGRVKRQSAATESKCWIDKGVNPMKLIQKVFDYNQNIGLVMELQYVFKLRKKEAALLKPFESDYGEILLILNGTKGGRQRVINIDSDIKRALIDKAKLMVIKKYNSCVPTNLTLKKFFNKYAYACKKFGITKKQLGISSHGLRHQGANEMYEEIVGEKSPIQGGKITVENKELINYAFDRIALDLGHARRDITSVYIGSQKLKRG